MDKARYSQAWAARAQKLAEHGIVECRMCLRREDLKGALQIWRNGVLVYAICEFCAQFHDILITPSERGIEVRAKRRRAYAIESNAGGGA